VPEGDTIHHAAARIGSLLLGRVPDTILTPQPRHGAERWPERLAGRTLTAVDAHGKHLFLRFEGALTLHSHLRMSGSWGVYEQGQPWRRSRGRAWLILGRGERQAVQFDGPVLELMSDARTRSDPRLARLGQDVIGASFDEALFLRRLREDDPTRPIGDALLDQRTVAGIGNLWKAECCFAAELDPWRPVAKVSDEHALAAVGFAREHMARSAREGPSARPRAVYRRAGMPCPRCSTAVLQRGQGENNRLTFWCPGCQR
jgi:endonuclease VIII